MNLSKVHIFQEIDANTCGPCCLAMVYALKNKNIRLAEILKDLGHPEKGKATYVPQLAHHLLKNEINTRIISSTSKILSPAWKELSPEEIIEKLKLWLNMHKKDQYYINNKYLLGYLQDGGKIEQTSYTVDTIKSMLDLGSVILVCLDAHWLWGHRFKFTKTGRVLNDLEGSIEGHFVLVTGYTDKKFHILDPLPTNIEGRHGEYEIDQYQLLNASLTWDAEIIEIIK